MLGSHGLKLNISEADNAMDLDLVRSVAPYFRISVADANAIIERYRGVVVQWPKIASSLQLSAREQEVIAPAFQLAGK